jgi:hypothetical protein
VTAKESSPCNKACPFLLLLVLYLYLLYVHRFAQILSNIELKLANAVATLSSLVHAAQIASGVPSASYPICTEVSSCGVKAA